jgi:hypothetical protein
MAAAAAPAARQPSPSPLSVVFACAFPSLSSTERLHCADKETEEFSSVPFCSLMFSSVLFPVFPVHIKVAFTKLDILNSMFTSIDSSITPSFLLLHPIIA